MPSDRPLHGPTFATRRPRSDTADAFITDPGAGPARVPDYLAETLAEEFLLSATSGEEDLDEALYAAGEAEFDTVSASMDLDRTVDLESDELALRGRREPSRKRKET